jgi:TatD DNase family protein
MLIDTHCHLDFPEFDNDRSDVISRAKATGVGYIINAGSSLAASLKGWELSQEHAFIYPAAGIHPHDADTADEKTLEALNNLARRKKVCAVGETGLDYFKNFSDPKKQMALFVHCVRLAKELDLPLIIHSRQAQADTLAVLRSHAPLKAVVHCFSGDEEFLKECLDLGFLVSFTCNITYPKAQNLRAVAGAVPLERLMLETDAPFLSPEGFRGKRNEPAQVKVLAQALVDIRQISFDEIARVTTDNARRFFRLP